MELAVYSFERLELNHVLESLKKLGHKILISDIYLYSENTKKEKMSQRQAFKSLLNDYKEKKMDAIIFINLESMGKSKYIRSLIFKELLEKNYKFCCIEENLHNLNNGGEIFVRALIQETLEEKQYSDLRSKTGRELKKSQNKE